MTGVGAGGGTVAGVMLTIVALACAVGGYVWHGRRSKQQQQQARDAVLGGGEVLEMVDNPLWGGGGRGAGAGAGADSDADGNARADTVDNGAHASIYDPPAWVPPAQEYPAYYSSVAAAPGNLAEYAAPNELGGNAVYGGVEAGDLAAAYASPNEGGSAVYARTGSDGSAAAYAPITNASGIYAPSGDVGMGNGAALYTNDAYSNVAGSIA